MMTNTIKLQGLLVWLVCVLFYLYEFFLRTILGTFQQPLMAHLKLNSFDFALLSSTAYLSVYGLMQIPAGTMLSRLGIKKSMIFATVVCTIATFGFSFSNSYCVALFFRALMGLGSAFGFLGVILAVYNWMPARNIGLFIGLSQFLGTLGPMIGAGPLDTLAQSSNLSWKNLFIILSLIGLSLTFLMAIIVKENVKEHSSFILLSKSTHLKNDLLKIFAEKQVWYIASFCALVYFSLEYLSENECKNLLLAKGFSSTFASYMITLSWLGFAIGAPLFGYLSDKIKQRKPILIFSASFSFLALFSIIYLPLAKSAIAASFLTFGTTIGASSVGIAVMAEQFKSDKISTGLGINNAVTILFVSIMAPLISYLLTLISNGAHYILADFQYVFILILFMPILALGILLDKIKETFGRTSKEPTILNYKNISFELKK